MLLALFDGDEGYPIKSLVVALKGFRIVAGTGFDFAQPNKGLSIVAHAMPSNLSVLSRFLASYVGLVGGIAKE